MADCKTCKSVRASSDVPYVAHEAALSRMERANKRLIILIVILMLALIGSNVAWCAYESQFTDETTTEICTACVDGDGTAIANGNGDVEVNGQG